MKVLFFLIVSMFMFAYEFKVAAYNVENLFDLRKDGSEYKEYIPNNKHNWNRKNYEIKLKNITKVLKDLDADILALVEIENKSVLIDLKKRLKLRGINYPYFAIANNKKTTVKVALLSKFPIIKKREIKTGYSRGTRNILKTNIKIKDKELIVYINHWHSKRSPESKRINYAKALKRDIDNLKNAQDFIILGDFNCNYNEFQTFKRDKRLNNTKGKTGINHILKTIKNGKLVTKNFIKNANNNEYLYNLWLEIPKKDRWTHKFRKKPGSLDSMIISSALFDNKAFSYKEASFSRFEKKYFFKNDKIIRWQISKRGRVRRHCNSA